MIPERIKIIYGFGLCFGVLFQVELMKEMRKSEERKNSTEKINTATWLSILEPEQFTSPAQEETSGEKKTFPTPPQTYETNILLPVKGCFL